MLYRRRKVVSLIVLAVFVWLAVSFYSYVKSSDSPVHQVHDDIKFQNRLRRRQDEEEVYPDEDDNAAVEVSGGKKFKSGKRTESLREESYQLKEKHDIELNRGGNGGGWKKDRKFGAQEGESGNIWKQKPSIAVGEDRKLDWRNNREGNIGQVNMMTQFKSNNGPAGQNADLRGGSDKEVEHLYDDGDAGEEIEVKRAPQREGEVIKTTPYYSFEHKEIVAKAGLGDNGGGAVETGGGAKTQTEDADWLLYAHNEQASRRISLHMSRPDVRDRMCQDVQYPDGLPEASVIVVFRNEAWTTLLRTVHSALERSPTSLVKELILIDDLSTLSHLKQTLDDYIALLPKVRLIRNERRLGVIRSRQVGAESAQGKVLIFLDSHSECTPGWLEPLLSRISECASCVVTPVMDVIDDNTFELRSFDTASINIGGFDWNLQFTWISIPEREKKRRAHEIDPVRSPTMSGGMFAIDKQRFFDLGGFDPDMDQWGGENLEFSFKTWMCGGSLETIPCSHVGHVFRKRSTHQMEQSSNPRKNLQRVAEIWMDGYRDLYYQNIGSDAMGAFGDVEARKKIRETLKCQPFSWFLKNIYPELFVPSDALASGQIRNKMKGFADGSKFAACIDSIVGPNAYEKPIKVWPCHNQGGNQVWLLSKIGEIRRDDSCLDYAGTNVVIYPCHGQRGNQQWNYLPDNTVRHVGTRMCMELSADSTGVKMSKCKRGEERQIWTWQRSPEFEAEAAAARGDGDGANGGGKPPLNGQELA